MPAVRPTRFTTLVIGATAVLTSTLTALGANVVSYIKGDQAVEYVYHVNVQTSLTGTGVSANSSNLYDYNKQMGYTPLAGTGGELKEEYAIMRWDYPEAYTGAVVSMSVDIATASTSNDTYVDCNIQAASADTSSGTALFDNLLLSVGAKRATRHSFSGGTVPTIGPNQQIACFSSFGTGAGLVGDWNVEYRETELN